jgi:hypothetical protein
MNNFFTTPATNEIVKIKIELLEKGFNELQSTSDASILFIDRKNKNFWDCNANQLVTNNKLVNQHHKEEVNQITLNEIQAWN